MISPGFFTLFNAQRGLMAAQTGLNTVNQNIANANTPGYSKQRVDFAAAQPYSFPMKGALDPNVDQQGQGVVIQQITRQRDLALDTQYRTANSSGGYDQVYFDRLKLLEGIVTEPSDNGISAGIQKYFDSLQELSLYPDNMAVRTSFLQTAQDMVITFQRKATQLQDLQTDLVGNNTTSQLYLTVTDINTKLTNLAEVNNQIITVQSTGAQPNDLWDRRDKILDDLSELVDIDVTYNNNGTTSVSIAGQAMVQGGTLRDTLSLAANGGAVPDPDYVPTLIQTTTGGVYLNDGTGTDIAGGKLKGILDVGGNTGSTTSVYKVLDEINNLMRSIAIETNTLQATGRDLSGALGSNPIFTPAVTAAAPPLEVFQYAVNSAVLADPTLIAAAKNDASAPANFAGVGDGRNALLMAQKRTATITTPVGTPLNMSFESYFNRTVARLGVDTASQQSRASNQEQVLQEVDLRRQAVSGVNMDEEMVDLLRYQRAFESSSKLIQAYDQMMQKLLDVI